MKKEHFFLLWQTKSGMCYERRGSYSFPWSSFFSPFTVLAATLNAGQVQRVHRPNLWQTEKLSEEEKVLLLPSSSQSQLSAKAFPTHWPIQVFCQNYDSPRAAQLMQHQCKVRKWFVLLWDFKNMNWICIVDFHYLHHTSVQVKSRESSVQGVWHTT